ncbi:MAG: hypothetical protein QG597_1239 [Actinomycetota bacterium]|nr:hypothetical protein [Actinomycetota bacterium]
MRRALPDPAALAAAATARVDGVERELAAVRDDVTALGRGVTDLITQIRSLSATGTVPTAPGGPDGSGHGSDGPGLVVDGQDATRPEEDQEKGQPDWLAVHDPEVASSYLTEAQEWANDVLIPHGVYLAEVPCWPLHPVAVADLLALSGERAHCYGAPDPTPVVEWLTRWLPAGLERLQVATADCRRDRAHHYGGRLYDAAGLTTSRGLADVAIWWTTHRDIPAPIWLHLPPID